MKSNPVFCKKGALKISAKFPGKHLCWRPSVKKAAEMKNFIKNLLQHWCFPVNFAKFLWTAIL